MQAYHVTGVRLLAPIAHLQQAVPFSHPTYANSPAEARTTTLREVARRGEDLFIESVRPLATPASDQAPSLAARVLGIDTFA